MHSRPVSCRQGAVPALVRALTDLEADPEQSRRNRRSQAQRRAFRIEQSDRAPHCAGEPGAGMVRDLELPRHRDGSGRGLGDLERAGVEPGRRLEVVERELVARPEPQAEPPGLGAKPEAVLAAVIVELGIVAARGNERSVEPAEARTGFAAQRARHHAGLPLGSDDDPRVGAVGQFGGWRVRGDELTVLARGGWIHRFTLEAEVRGTLAARVCGRERLGRAGRSSPLCPA